GDEEYQTVKDEWLEGETPEPPAKPARKGPPPIPGARHPGMPPMPVHGTATPKAERDALTPQGKQAPKPPPIPKRAQPTGGEGEIELTDADLEPVAAKGQKAADPPPVKQPGAGVDRGPFVFPLGASIPPGPGIARATPGKRAAPHPPPKKVQAKEVSARDKG